MECALELAGSGDWSENTLVSRCVAGEVAAWRQLHRQYYPIARAFLRRMGVPPDEVEDACQDAFLQVFRSLSSFRGDASLKTWLYRLCLTQASRRRRRSGAVEAVRSLLTLHAVSDRVGPAEISDESLHARLQAALGRLGEGERAVFVLYELEAASGKEIADVLQCPEATVWRRLHYARRKVRSFLTGDAA
jgi:RNA polymerase sigma-70 factor (ECF subfamily)